MFLAAGYLMLEEAVDYIACLPNIKDVAIGFREVLTYLAVGESKFLREKVRVLW